MKFSSVLKGTKARRTIDVFFVGMDDPTKVDVRVLSAADEANAYASALEYAKGKGVATPGRGDPLFDLAMWAEKALLSCIDPESPADAPEPFFENTEQILKSDLVTIEHLAYINEHQETWQDEHSPYEVDVSGLSARVAEMAKGDIAPFFMLRPSSRVSLVHFLALQHVTSLELRSSPGSTSPETSPPVEADA